ncbi:hypothetical protein [Caudoviricetes sp.]|nr:hypothetical protein [Caudoviricetes sp.]
MTNPFIDLTPDDNPFADLLPKQRPMSRSFAPSDATQTKATTKNVTGRRNDWADAARVAAQGATFGFADEGLAAARSLLGTPYEKALADERTGVATFKKENPGTAFALEAAGALVPGVGAAKVIGGAKQAATALEAAKTAAQAGAISGAATGVGTGTDWRERVTGGLLGGLLGGATGAAAGGAGQKVAQKVSQQIGQRSVPRSDRLVLDAMASDKLTPAAAQQMLTDVPLTREVSLADLGGDATRRMAGTASLTPTPQGAVLREKMQARTLAGGQDFADLLQQTTGTTRENVNTAQAAMKAARASTSGPLFEAAAKSGPVADGRLVDLVKVSPEAQKAYAAMQTAAQRRNLPVPSLDEFMSGQPLDARAAHWWKLEMDGIKNAAKKQAARAEGGMTTTAAAQIAEDAAALRNTLADVIPDYGKALETYSKASKTMKAYRSGLKGATLTNDVESLQAFTNAKPEDVAAFMAQLSPEEQVAYRAGSIQDLMRNTENGTAAAKRITRMVDNPAEANKYRQLFDGPDAQQRFDRFVAGGKVQRNQRLAEEEVIGSAKTAARQEAARSLAGEASIPEEAARNGSIKQTLESRFWRWLAQKRLGDAAGGVAETMTPQTRAQIQQLLTRLEQMQRLQAGSNPALRAFAGSGALIGSGSGRAIR